MTPICSTRSGAASVCCLVAFALSFACTHHPPASPHGYKTEEQPTHITQKQAQAIAAGASGNLRQFEISAATLVKKSFWRVVVDCHNNGSTLSFTNTFPSGLTAREAERVSAEAAKERFGKGQYTVHSAQILQGFFWIVTVWSLPASPGGFTTLTISAEDGSVIRSEPGI